MKYALINGDKAEATKVAKGICPSCGSELIAKCGELKVNHWSHKGNRNCDQWWENETEWHRSWKNRFPKEWQEVIHTDEKSWERHIADVKTPSGWILEFQHSFLNPEERSSRETFYQKLVWVVDGTRRKTDGKQFQAMLDRSKRVAINPPIVCARFPDECRLLKEWHNDNSLVFFDFNEARVDDQSMLWFLFPKTHSSNAYLSPFLRTKFIQLFNDNNFDDFRENTILPIHTEITNLERRQHEASMRGQGQVPSWFDRYLSSKHSRRGRL